MPRDQPDLDNLSLTDANEDISSTFSFWLLSGASEYIFMYFFQVLDFISWRNVGLTLSFCHCREPDLLR